MCVLGMCPGALRRAGRSPLVESASTRSAIHHKAERGLSVPITLRALFGLSASVLACVLGPRARAASHVTPFAVIAVEHNSNVFMRPSSAPPFAFEGITAFGDTIENYQAGVDSEFDWSTQRLTLQGQATRSIYNRFSFLDHTEYHFGGDFNWRLGTVFDATASYHQSRVMAQFADTLSTQLLLNTERTAQVVLRVLVTPQWRISLTPAYHEFDTPLPSFPDFRLQENKGTAELQYLGFGRLKAGLQFAYTHGRYAGIVGATRYDQRDAGLTASYKVSGFSTFEANLGYTRRDSVPNVVDSIANPGAGAVFAGYEGTIGRTSSVTGALSYHRQFTGKTSGYISLFRRVDSYTAGANPEIGTGGAVGLTWRADARFTVNLDYSLTRDEIRGGLIVANVVNRSDRTQWARMNIRYKVSSWLSIRPYVTWERESSTFDLGNYTATIVGIDFTGRFRH